MDQSRYAEIAPVPVNEYRKGLCFDDDLNSRVTDYLVAQVQNLEIGRVCHSTEISFVIKGMEGWANYKRFGGSTKPATKFKRGPIRDLLHKHILPSTYLLRNMRLEWDSKQFSEKSKRFFSPLIGETIDEEISGEIAHHFVLGALQSRSERGAMTGEWLIYQIYEGRNYYLGLGYHGFDEQRFVDDLTHFSEAQLPNIRKLVPSLSDKSSQF